MCGFAWIVVLSIPFFPPLHGRCLVKVRRERKRSVNAHRRVWFFSSSCIFYISLSCAEIAETRSYTRPLLLPQYSLDRQKREREGPPPDVVANRKTPLFTGIHLVPASWRGGKLKNNAHARLQNEKRKKGGSCVGEISALNL